MAKFLLTLPCIKREIMKLGDWMKSTAGFIIPDVFSQGVLEADKLEKSGQFKTAATVGMDTLTAGRKIFAAFLRYSVFDKRDGETLVRQARFARDIERCRDQKYDADLLVSLEASKRELEKAVTLEAGDMFAQRVALYNAMRVAIMKAPKLQANRMKVRKVTQEQALLTHAVIQAGYSGHRVRREMITQKDRQPSI